MAEYKVGNLEITFKAIDKASASFDTLKNNLEAVKSAIESFGGISQKSLDKFGKVMDAISAKFAPLLTDIKGATKGIAAFNQVVQNVGVKGISQAADEMARLRKESETGAEDKRVKAPVGEGTAREDGEDIKTVSEIEKSLNEKLLEQQQILRNTRAEWRKAFMGGDEQRAHELAVEIENITSDISSLKSEIKGMEGVTEAISLPFNEAKAAVSSLMQELTNMQFSKGYIDFFKVQELKQKQQAINETTEAVKRAMMTEQELVVEQYRSAQAAQRQRIEYLQIMLATGQAGDRTREYRKELADLQKQQDKSEKSTKKGTSAFSKFFNQIKRIAVYRLIRAALKEIAQAFQETVKAFAEVDDGTNTTMSNITSSLNIIKLSLGSTVLPLLQMVDPIINQIGVSLANVANLIGQAMSETGTYTKINIEAWQDYRKELNKTQGALFDFDKFRSLNNKKQSSLSDFLLPNEEVDESNEKVSALKDTFAKLKSVISSIGNILTTVGTRAFEVFIGLLQTALDIAKPLIEGFSTFISKLDELGLLKPMIEGITYALLAMGAVKVINGLKNVGLAISQMDKSTMALYATIGILMSAISYFVSNLDEMSSTAKVLVPIIALLAATVAGLAVANAAAAAGIAAPVQAGITAAALAGAIALVAGTAMSVGKFAEGGLPDKGTMFIAGEAGAEMVYNMPSGQSGVANVSQIAQAEYQAVLQALKDYGAARGDMPQLKEVSATGLYEINRTQQLKRGQRTVNV